MSSQGKFSSTTIALLIIGLVIGAGGGYFASTSSLQPKITDLEEQVSSLNSEVATLNTEVTALEEETSNLETQISELNTQKSSLETQLETAQATISEKENTISDLQETIADHEEQLSTRESEIQVLESMLIPSTGYEKFSAYGFSFEYPKQFYLSFEGLLETAANEDSGLVMAKKIDETEALMVLWADVVYPKDLDLALAEAFEGLAEISTTYTEGEKITSTINGHEIKYQDYTATLEGETAYGVYSYWNCDVKQMFYGLVYSTNDKDALTPFLQCLDSFICHSSPARGQIIRIGVTSSSTADLETTQALVQIVEEDINEYVDALGLDITFEFVIKDNQGTAAVALANTQEFKAMGIDLIIGHGWSSQCQASLSYVNENDMILVSSSSTSPILAIPDDRLFRTCPNDFVQAPALAEMWLTWGVKGVLTMFRADAWGDGLWNIFEPEIEARGLDNLGKIRYAGEVTEFSSYLDEANQIVAAAAEEYGGLEYVGMQFYVFAELRTIQVQAADYPNLMDIIWMTTESGGRSQAMLSEAGEWATQTHHFSSFGAVDESSSTFQEFNERYFDLTGYRVNFYTAAQYDAIWLMTKSILETGSTDASVIADVLIPMSHRQRGISGHMALDENGDRLPQMFDIWGLYEDLDTGEYAFRKFGWYDGHIIEVDWWDDTIEYYTDITRPGKGD